MNILPPVQHSGELQKRSLHVSKDLNEITPSSEVLLKPAEGFESPGVCRHRTLDGGKQWVGGDGTKWILQSRLNRVPFDGQLLEQVWIDNMTVRFAAMGSPHSLFNR